MRYVRIDTGIPTAAHAPPPKKQKSWVNYCTTEKLRHGHTDASPDEYGYVYARHTGQQR